MGDTGENDDSDTSLSSIGDYEDAPQTLQDGNVEESPIKEKSEEAQFRLQPWEQQWREVVRDLASGKAKWDELGDGQGHLLEEYKKNTFINGDARERTTPTFFHVLAKGCNTDDLEKVSESTILKIIDFILRNQECNLAGEIPVLRVAMEYNNTKFIESVIERSAAFPGKFEKLLDAICIDGMNSLHYAFKEQLPKALTAASESRKGTGNLPERDLEKTLKIIHQLVKAAKPKSIASRDKHGNTPIHYALNYHNCRIKLALYSHLVQHLVRAGDKVFKDNPADQFNNENESPYLYHLRTREEWFKDNKGMTVITSPVDVPLEGSNRLLGKEANGAETMSSLEPVTAEMSTAEIQDTLLPPASDQNRTPRPENGEKRGDNEYDKPQSLHAIDSVRKKTLSSSIPVLNNEKPQRNKSFNLPDTAKDIGEFVKVHYIRTRADTDAKQLLYGKVASDKNLYFDASYLIGQPIEQIVDLIEKLANAGGFEDTLSYVSLPVLQVATAHKKSTTYNSDKREPSSTEKRQREDTSQEHPELECSALIKIFDKLVSVNVRRILRLQVNDGGSQPHTDATIERAILGRDSFSLGTVRSEAIKVDEWDWRKPDLSMDVISFAAPDATHVHLYWSGNQTVLRGWGRPEGVARPGGKLKKVTLHAFQGHESKKRMIKMIEGFEDEIQQQMKDKPEKNQLKIKRHIHSDPVASIGKLDASLNTPVAGLSDNLPQQFWVPILERFRGAMFKIHRAVGRYLEIPRVKLSMLDDGGNLPTMNTYNNTVRFSGISYCPPNGKTEQPWHQSHNGHGTVMANMITRINPWVNLEIMRIHDSVVYTHGGKTRTISPESAARAIEDAIIRKADIISMSWSIRKLATSGAAPDTMVGEEHKKSPNEVGMKRLQDAIENAKRHNILMFCSAADDIQLLGKDSLPFSAAPDSIFRIGAALPTGQRDPTSEDVKTISYFFPGNQVAEATDPRSSKKVEFFDGSSVSTALASGLASLIIYCVNVLKTCKCSEPFTQWALKLRSHENMKKAFDNINSQHESYEDRKFLHVWKIFGDATDRIDKAKTKDEMLSELEKLVRDLCNRIETDS